MTADFQAASSRQSTRASGVGSRRPESVVPAPVHMQPDARPAGLEL